MNLEKLYDLLAKEQEDLQRFYQVLGSHRSLLDPKTQELESILEEFLEFIGLQKNSDMLVAAINRIVNLREDMLLQVIKDFEEEQRIQIKEKAYVWVSRFYLERFERLIAKIEKEHLLSPFYLALIKHVHRIGEVFSSWQSSWMAQIIYGTNRELYRLFNGDEEKIFEMLAAKNLLDRCDGEVADRCYSVLRMREDGSFERLSYAQAFKEEVQEAIRRLEDAIGDLSEFEDEVFGQKREWIEYLTKIKEALKEEDPDSLVSKWADVDRAWMKITTPIQIGHPLEYYEDHYRKAVALEWDLRLADPNYQPSALVDRIKAVFRHYYLKIGMDRPSVYEQTLASLDRVQTYVGRPMLFYGSEFNGLFSAQVVPNDERVSAELGKKIFAYADMVYETQKAKPKMKIGQEVYGKELYEKFRSIYDHPKIWHRVYEVSTLGHEYGHILWMDASTEVEMNASGQFKNLEEFKATCGGLVSYFLYGEEDLWKYLLEDHLTRAVSLVGWMEVDEVLPYYVEGLLHLVGLFESEVFAFDGKLHLDLSKDRYEKLKKWYLTMYERLAKHYLDKRDAREFLSDFVEFGDRILPKRDDVRAFVEYYYDLYQKIGRKLAD